ncbi:hypothetical protein HG535_0F01760 [Zygotorulaspora mrakii]|uniref:Uncharacterized protein n=1 Tax=Zygotorulaspora mrakii TaxID=42260 RepID=A0A7H9B4Q5_ZYGMR|nr:uncharacterized protein HG535_0F01760 [Zygotorulaspora mrakii]QLG73665.1 hypothetical protein HG535_0F01760 [Zygotorulaspora mrakii]
MDQEEHKEKKSAIQKPARPIEEMEAEVKNPRYTMRHKGRDVEVDMDKISKPHAVSACKGFPDINIGHMAERSNAGGLLRNDGHRPSSEKK